MRLPLLLASLSTLTSPLAQADGPSKGPLLALKSAGIPYVVLATQADAAWASGPVELLVAEAPLFEVRQPVDVKALPADLAAWAGKRVSLSGSGTSSMCEGTVGSFWRMNRFETEEFYESETHRATPTTQAERDALAAALTRPEERALLVGALVDVRGACTAVTHGKLAESAQGTIYGATIATGKVRDGAIAAFRALPLWKSIQKEYVAWGKEHKPAPGEKRSSRWDEYGAPIQVQTLTDGGPEGFVVVTAWDPDGCGDYFRRGGSALFAFKGKAITLVSRSDALFQAVTVQGAEDADGDGKPELLIHDGLLEWRDGAPTQTLDASPINHMCPC